MNAGFNDENPVQRHTKDYISCFLFKICQKEIFAKINYRINRKYIRSRIRNRKNKQNLTDMIESYLPIEEVIRVAKTVRRRRHPSRLRPPLGEPGIRRGLRQGRHHLHRPVARDHAPRSATRSRRATWPSPSACRSCRRPIRCPTIMEAIKAAAQAIGYPVMLKASWGGGGRGMRVIRERGRRCCGRGDAARREAKAAFGKDEVYLEKLVAPRPPRRGADPRRQARQPRASLRARLLGAAPQPEGRRARAGALSRRDDQREALCEAALKIGQGDRLCRRRHRRVPDGRRHRQVLLHRGQPAHPGRAHGDRGGHRPRHRQGADPHRSRAARIGDSRPSGVPPQARSSASTATRCSAASPRKTPSRTSSRTTAASPPIAARSGFGIRLDGGTAYSGAVHHPLLRLAAGEGHRLGADAGGGDRPHGPARSREFRIRGVATNLTFLDNVIKHPAFRDKSYTTRFIDETPELFRLGEAARTARPSC